MYILEKLNFKISRGSMSRDPPGVLYRDIYFKDRSSCVRACTNPRNVTTFEATATTKRLFSSFRGYMVIYRMKIMRIERCWLPGII